MTSKKYPWRWNQFKQFTYNPDGGDSLTPGKVDILWLDGGWVCKENNQDIDMPKIATMARAHQPGLIMVDRTIHGPYEIIRRLNARYPTNNSTIRGRAAYR